MIQHLVVLAQIFLINLVMSADNLLVIALIVKNRPQSEQKWVTGVGVGLGVLVRLILVWLLVPSFHDPWVRLSAGVFLWGVAAKLIQENKPVETTSQGSSLFKTLGLLVLGDMLMSFDNMIGLMALADGDQTLLVVGLCSGIPLLIWGSSMMLRMLERFPWLNWLVLGLLWHLSGKLLFNEVTESIWPVLGFSWVQQWGPWLMILLGWLWVQRKRLWFWLV